MKTSRRKGRNGLGLNPDATLAEARSILKVARAEAKDEPQGINARQAAEKVWLATSTAADALTGGKIQLSTHIFSAFERAWGAEGRQIAEDAESALHRGCFYSNAAACTGAYVERHAARLGKVLARPIRDVAFRKRVMRARVEKD